jgi:tRNA-dihydrouridine synthase A
LKREFPELEIILNGGIKTTAEMQQHLQHVDGVMIGREAYHNPYFMADFDALFYDDMTPVKTREEILHAMIPYIHRQLELYGNGGKGLRLNSVIRHMLGLMMGLVGARAFRQTLSDSKKLASGNPDILLEAFERMQTVTAYDRSLEVSSQ